MKRRLFMGILFVCVSLGCAQAQVISHLQFPVSGSTEVDTPVTLVWDAVPGAQKYLVWIGTYLGAHDVYFTGETTATTAVASVPPGGTYFVRVWTNQPNGVWVSSDSIFTARQVATLSSPVNGSTGLGASVSPSWDATTGALSYYLQVGTQKGAADVFTTGETSALSASLDLQSSTTYYARLWTKFADAWGYTDTTFQTTDFRATLIQPLDHSYFPPSGTIMWTAGISADGYEYTIGTAPGLSDVYSSPILTTTQDTPAVALSDGFYYITLGTHTADGWAYQPSTRFVAGNALAHLTYPLDGDPNVDPFASFTWTSVTGAEAYYLYVGTQPGLNDVVNSTELHTTSYYPKAMTAGKKYYARMFTKLNGAWDYEDTTFTEGSASSVMLYPANGATNVNGRTPFQWSAVAGAQGYIVKVGTTPGAQDYWSSGFTTNTDSGTSLPPFTTFGQTYYINLSTERNNTWHSVLTSFVSGNGAAALTQPKNGQTLFDPIAPFKWNAIPAAQKYYLWVGSAKGLKDVYNSGETTNLSLVAPNLQINTTYWARLYTKFNGLWYFQQDVQFTTGPGPAQFTNPTNGQTGVDPFTTFTWQGPSTGADKFWLMIGTTVGARDVYDSGMTTVKKWVVPNLLPNQLYYARLWTLAQGVWRSVDISFTTGASAVTPPADSASLLDAVKTTTASVRQMANNNGVPTAGTLLASLVPAGNLAACNQYALALQTLLNQQGIAARQRHLSLDGTSWESHDTIEYYDPYKATWAVADPTFAILYYDSSTSHGQSVEEISGYLVAGTLSNIKPMYATGMGATYAGFYYMDPITLYLNYIPPQNAILQSPDGQPAAVYTTNAPDAYFTTISLPSLQTVGGTYLGFKGLVRFNDNSNTNSFTIATPPDPNIVLAPADGTVYSKGVVLSDGWSIVNSPVPYTVLGFKRVMF